MNSETVYAYSMGIATGLLIGATVALLADSLGRRIEGKPGLLDWGFIEWPFNRPFVMPDHDPKDIFDIPPPKQVEAEPCDPASSSSS